jgi:uncharacterized repeat protein (TIGR01451 family)
MSIRRFSFVRFAIVLLLTFVFSFTGGGGLPGLFSQKANAHSVAQVQTAKYFAPETVQMLTNRITSGGTPGLRDGDVVSYIIQFNPVANGATVGAGGYVTDYIPANTEVVDASMVQPDGAGGFVAISPGLPGPMSNGYGSKGQQTFSNWSVTNPLCTAANKTAINCTGSLAQVYADTGIFYSTDLRTRVNINAGSVPDPDGRVRQGTNGYILNPTAEGQLNGYLNQTDATTHNRWDADQTNAFGTTTLPTGSPISSQPMIIPGNNKGRGATPFNSGSAVAGPDTGYQLDNTGTVGPWQRISYPGSRTGNPTGPATSATGSHLDPLDSSMAVVGTYTSAGRSVSLSNPLPANTNAVRWALGRLNVGEIKYVKLTLRLTANPSPSGLINNSEVFGGDSAEAAGKTGNDAVWRYHVPSVADNNSNLFLYKEVICVYSGSSCLPSDGNLIPTDAKIRYRITYLNTGNTNQTNVILSDKLPSQTPANAVSNVVVVSGPDILPFTPVNPGTGATITFQPIPSLAPGIGGVVTMDVQTNVTTGNGFGNLVTNQARLISNQVSQIASSASSSATDIANLQISKTVDTSNAQPGGLVTYTLKIENTGVAPATNLRVYDFLPTNGGTTANDRFNFVVGSSNVNVVNGIISVVPITSSPPSLVPFTSQNRQQVVWDFGGTSSLAAEASFTIQFQARVGNNVPNLTTPYTNDARVVYRTTFTGTSDNEANASATAPVMVVKPADVSITKSHLPISPIAGRPVTYTIVVSNGSSINSVVGAVVTDAVPANITNVTWSCAATAGSSCATANGTSNAINTTVTLAPSGTATYTVLGTVAINATGVIPNTADVTVPVNIIDANTDNNRAIDNLTVTSRSPNLVLVKRVTAIGSTPIITTVDDTRATSTAANDNNLNWPSPNSSNGVSPVLKGSLDASKVRPGEEIEYTIYFLSAGNVPLKKVNICDLVPTYTSYVNGSGQISFNGRVASSLGGSEFLPAGSVNAPGIGLCKTPRDPAVNSLLATENPLGLVWVTVDSNSNRAPANAPLSPNEYGYIRFRVVTDLNNPTAVVTLPP